MITLAFSEGCLLSLNRNDYIFHASVSNGIAFQVIKIYYYIIIIINKVLTL